MSMTGMYNKKGDVAFRSIMFAFVKFIIVILVLFTLIGFIMRFVYFDADTTDLEAEIFVNSVMRSEHGPSVYDMDTERVYPYLVDLEFFNDYTGQLQKAMNFSEDYIAAKITIYNDEGKGTINGKKVPPVYYNKKMFQVWKELAEMRFGKLTSDKGPGDVADYTKKYYVNIRDGKSTHPGFIKIRVLILKS